MFQLITGLSISNTQAVPLLDHSVAGLLGTILSDEHEQIGLLQKQLHDPYLLFWLVSQHPPLTSMSEFNAQSLSQWACRDLMTLLQGSLVSLQIPLDRKKAIEEHFVHANEFARHVRTTTEEISHQDSERTALISSILEVEDYIVPISELLERESNADSVHENLNWLRFFRQEVDSDGPAIRRWVRYVRTAKEHPALNKYVNDVEVGMWTQDFPSVRSLLSKALDRMASQSTYHVEFQKRLESEKLASMRELAYGASHEINNPLTNISTRAQTLLHDETHPERRRQLATITSQAYRAHEMIADLMLFAKPPKPNLNRIDLHRMLSELRQSLIADADIECTTIELFLDDFPIHIDVDKVQLDVAIRAIVKNAAESTNGNSTISIHTKTLTEQTMTSTRTIVELEIHDNGPGIPPDVRAHLFDPFFSGREAGRGLGFGLSKAWRIIQEHAGEIIVTSNSGSGTVFTIRLPS